MRYLLDTHTFLWAIDEKEKISASAMALMSDGETELYLSLASTWEIAIKVGIGKLDLPQPLEKFLAGQLEKNRIEVLPLTLEHTCKVAELPRSITVIRLTASSLPKAWPQTWQSSGRMHSLRLTGLR